MDSSSKDGELSSAFQLSHTDRFVPAFDESETKFKRKYQEFYKKVTLSGNGTTYSVYN